MSTSKVNVIFVGRKITLHSALVFRKSPSCIDTSRINTSIIASKIFSLSIVNYSRAMDSSLRSVTFGIETIRSARWA